jgi:hypothetical protein
VALAELGRMTTVLHQLEQVVLLVEVLQVIKITGQTAR